MSSQGTVVHCPSCGNAHKLTAEQVAQYAGRAVGCKRCHQPFVVPETLLASAPPAPLPPPYAIPPDPYAEVQPPAKNGMATASLVCGLILCVPVTGILAIVFGLLGLRKVRREGAGGRGMAVAGLSLGAVNIVVGSLLISILLPAFSAAKERATRIHCASNLRMIGQGLALYANDYRGHPPDLGTMAVATDLSPDVFLCPGHRGQIPSNYVQMSNQAKINWINSNTDYVYLASVPPQGPMDAVIVHEKPERHDKQGINVLYNDGHVEWQADSKRILSAIKSGRNPPRP